MKITDMIPWRGSGREVSPQATPTDPVGALQRDVDRAFEHFWAMLPYPFPSVARPEQPNVVRLDVDDNGKEITITAELPGVSEADVDVLVSDGQLTIRGEKKADHQVEDNGLLVRERIYGTVERTVPLPDNVNTEATQATFKNGVLTVTIPKSVELETGARRISVEAG